MASPLDEDELFHEGGRVLEQLHREIMESPSLEASKTHLDVFLLQVTLPWIVSRGPFKLFHDCVILKYQKLPQ